MKKMLTTALICIGVGLAVCGVAYAVSGNSTDENLTDTIVYFSSDDVNKINIKEHVSAIKIFKSTDNSSDIMIKAENIIAEAFSAVEKNGSLEISYNPHTSKIGNISLPKINLGLNKTAVINIYIPEEKIFEEVRFEGGVGTVNAEHIKTGSIIINGGVGTYNISGMIAENLKVDGGVGTIKIDGTVNGDTKIDGGVGTIDITGQLNGNIKLDTGVGSANLRLTGDINDYNVKANSGVGTIRINGYKASDLKKSEGKYNFNIDAGVGSINVSIK